MNVLLKKSVGRLISCQALCMYYDINITDKNLDKILEDINNNYVLSNFVDEDGKNNYKNVFKHDFVKNLINGVINNSNDLDTLINKLLNKQDTTETIDDILLQSFRLVAFELKNSDLDKEIIINEYTDIISEFYNGLYVNFANGVFNNLALIIRDKMDVKDILKDNVILENKKNDTSKNSDIQKKNRKVIILHKNYEKDNSTK